MSSVDYKKAFLVEGKVALVSGGGSGIGAEVVDALSQAGAAVVVTDIQEDAGRALVKKILERGSKAEFFKLDVCNESQWEAASNFVIEKFGRYDILVNNAGIETASLISQCDINDFRKVMDVNVTGVFLGMKYAIRLMPQFGGGSIVNMSSIAGIIGTTGHAAYHTSKGAVRILSKTGAIECAQLKTGIRVNSVHPGIVKNKMGDNFFHHLVELGLAPDFETVKSVVEASHPMGFGESQDVASAVLYLSSDAARWINGTELVLDGGYTAA